MCAGTPKPDVDDPHFAFALRQVNELDATLTNLPWEQRRELLLALLRNLPPEERMSLYQGLEPGYLVTKMSAFGPEPRPVGCGDGDTYAIR